MRHRGDRPAAPEGILVDDIIAQLAVLLAQLAAVLEAAQAWAET